MNNHLLAYLHSIGFSQKSLSRLFEHEENYEDFYRKLDSRILEKMGLKSEKIAIVLEKKRSLDEAKISNIFEKLGVQIVTRHHESYPSLLKESPVSPYFLYVRGALQDIPLISIVGSRKSTSYSRTAL